MDNCMFANPRGRIPAPRTSVLDRRQVRPHLVGLSYPRFQADDYERPISLENADIFYIFSD